MSGAASQFDIPPLSAGNLKRIRFLHLKKYRDAENAFLAEGVRLCEEALASNVHIRQAVTTDEAMKNARVAGLLSQCRRQNIPLFLAMPKQFDSLSEEQSPQGLAFVVDKPRIQASTGAEKLLLAVDHLQDPGNLGTILRSAEWFGVSKIVLGRGSVDVFNAKVVRASMGAIFRLSVEQGVDLARPVQVIDLFLGHNRIQLIADNYFLGVHHNILNAKPGNQSNRQQSKDNHTESPSDPFANRQILKHRLFSPIKIPTW